MKLLMPHEVIDCIHWMARWQKANPGLVFADRNNVMDPMDDPNDSDDSDGEMYISDDDGNSWSDSEDGGDADPSDDDSVYESKDDDDDTGIPDNDDDVIGDPEEVDNTDIDAMSADGYQNVVANVTDGDEDDDHGDNDDVQQDFIVDIDDANDNTEPKEETGVDPAPNDETGEETGVSDAPVCANQGLDATNMDERYGPYSGWYNLCCQKE
jgi:hypothetical protein